MDTRFGAILFVVLGVAVLVGIAAAQTQPKRPSLSVATVQPTAVLAPRSLVVEILARPPAGQIPSICGPEPGSSSSIYCPSKVTARVGDPVTWVNFDMKTHTVTADDGSFDSGVLTSQAGRSISQVGRDQVYIHRFTKSGAYTYSDYLNPDLHGVVVVR